MLHGSGGSWGILCLLCVGNNWYFKFLKIVLLLSRSTAGNLTCQHWGHHSQTSAFTNPWVSAARLADFKRLPPSLGAPQRIRHLLLHLFTFSCFRDIKAKQRKAVWGTLEHVAPVNISMCCQRDKLKEAGGLRWVPRRIKTENKCRSERLSCSSHLWGERKPKGPEGKAGE